MANTMDLTATQMVWEPPMLKLTYIGNPGLDDEQPTNCYISPRFIYGIHRARCIFDKEKFPNASDVHCTLVHYANLYLHVLETPEQVAMMRDKAFGHESKLKGLP